MKGNPGLSLAGPKGEPGAAANIEYDRVFEYLQEQFPFQKGEMGSKGEAGINGLRGPGGDPGRNGQSGAQGPEGPRGVPGMNGLKVCLKKSLPNTDTNLLLISC